MRELNGISCNEGENKLKKLVVVLPRTGDELRMGLGKGKTGNPKWRKFRKH